MLRLCPVMLVVVALIPTRVQLMCTDIMATTAQIATGHIMRSSFAASCPCRMIALLLASKLFFSNYERFAPWLDEHSKICVYTCKSCTDLKCLGTALKTKIIFPKKNMKGPITFYCVNIAR